VEELKITGQWWSAAVREAAISSNHVHIWQARLDINSDQTGKLLETLSPDEVERASRFRFEKDKGNFIAARGILRNILGAYLEIKPRVIQFEYGGNGKPAIATNSKSGIQFNVAHSGMIALYAVTLDRDIGIDIEFIRHDIDVIEIAQKFFSKTETSSLEKIDREGLQDLFYRYWTRKEALLKALGQGISFPMEKVDVSLINGSELTLVTLPGCENESPRFYAQDLAPAHNYAAAVAIGMPLK